MNVVCEQNRNSLHLMQTFLSIFSQKACDFRLQCDGHWEDTVKTFVIVPEEIVELLNKDSYIIFVPEVTRFLTTLYLLFLQTI